MTSNIDEVEANKILKMGGAPVGKMDLLDLEEYTIISFFKTLV